MCGWQIKLCNPLLTRGSYLSALAVVLPIIRCYTNNQITYLLTNLHLISHRFSDIAEYWSNYLCRKGVLLVDALVQVNPYIQDCEICPQGTRDIFRYLKHVGVIREFDRQMNGLTFK